MSTCLSCEKEDTAIKLTPIHPLLMVPLIVGTLGGWFLLWRVASKFMGREICANCGNIGFAGDRMYAWTKVRLIIANSLPLLLSLGLWILVWTLLTSKPGPGFFAVLIVLGSVWGVVATGIALLFTFKSLRSILKDDECPLKAREDLLAGHLGDPLWFMYWPNQDSGNGEATRETRAGFRG